ncbi:MAG: hypothetical protein DWQ08_09940 [Proteobacteria bacterium]|nr:MAG: hypothetical protein DWQ08_09940 [Pseudomonadota bacterium]
MDVPGVATRSRQNAAILAARPVFHAPGLAVGRRRETIVRSYLFVTIGAALTAGCLATRTTPIDTVKRIDLDSFMGDWYVIAHIPTFLERDAYNAVETYRLGDGNRVHTTFRFRKGGFEGPVKTMNPTGFVREGSGNAVWGMQFVWPFKAEYRVVYLDERYDTTIIGRSKRDYAWLMSRRPDMDAQAYQRMMGVLVGLGYDISQVRRVPQQWPASARSGHSNPARITARRIGSAPAS